MPSPGTYEYFACVRESTAPPSTDNCSRPIVVAVKQQTPDDPSIDPRFDDAFWQEFVFGQKDEPLTLDHQVIQVLNTTSPNVYIYTGFGHQAIPDEHRDIIRKAIPSAAEQLTGQRYSGRIRSGTEHLVERLGWITVRYFTDADQHGGCGFTRIGTDPNGIFLNHDCIKRRGPDAITYLKHVFVHEFGHAMAVSMARSEYWSCPLRLPTPAAAHVAIASGVSQRVTSPRRTRARSYSAQFPTRYVVLYFGCTLDFTSRS